MFNLVVLTGRLTSDVELKTTPNGVSVCSFAIANETGYGETKKTSFINVVAWRGTAEFISRNFTKGSLIGIEGSIQTRKYQDGNGNNRVAFEIVAKEAQFVLPKSASTNVPDANASATDPLRKVQEKLNDFVEIEVDSDLPF